MWQNDKESVQKVKISHESILISPWKNIYSGTTCRRLKMSGRLSHFCRKINFAAELEFMGELEIARNANSKGTRVLMILGAKRFSTIATIHLTMSVVASNNGVLHKYIITERNLPFYKAQHPSPRKLHPGKEYMCSSTRQKVLSTNERVLYYDEGLQCQLYALF